MKEVFYFKKIGNIHLSMKSLYCSDSWLSRTLANVVGFGDV